MRVQLEQTFSLDFSHSTSANDLQRDHLRPNVPSPWQNHPGASRGPGAPPGGYVVRNANGQALAYLYSRDNDAEARQAKVLTKDEARRIASNSLGVTAGGWYVDARSSGLP
jgi:hypothetical protein